MKIRIPKRVQRVDLYAVQSGSSEPAPILVLDSDVNGLSWAFRVDSEGRRFGQHAASIMAGDEPPEQLRVSRADMQRWRDSGVLRHLAYRTLDDHGAVWAEDRGTHVPGYWEQADYAVLIEFGAQVESRRIADGQEE